MTQGEMDIIDAAITEAVTYKLDGNWWVVSLGDIRVSKHRANSFAGTTNRNQSFRDLKQTVQRIVVAACKRIDEEKAVTNA